MKGMGGGGSSLPQLCYLCVGSVFLFFEIHVARDVIVLKVHAHAFGIGQDVYIYFAIIQYHTHTHTLLLAGLPRHLTGANQCVQCGDHDPTDAGGGRCGIGQTI